MITQTSANVATNFSEILVDNNIKLVPKNGTLLQELTSSIQDNKLSKIESKDTVSYFIEDLSKGSLDLNKDNQKYTQSVHDTIMDNYINDLSTLISNHISFARNVVNKEISKYIENINNRLSNYNYKDIESLFNITYFKLSDIFKSNIIDEEINNYNSSDVKYFFTFINLDVIKNDDFNLIDNILTGYEEQDILISNWFNGLGKEKAIRYLTTEVPEYSLSVNELLDYSLLNYLFYRHLAIHTDLNVGLTTVQLKSAASNNRDYFGKKVYIALKQYESDIRQGILLSTDSEVNFTYHGDTELNITIYEESFEKLAEAGGDITLVLSYIAHENDTKVTVEKLIKDMEKYYTKWKNIKGLYYSYLNSTKIDIYKHIIKSELVKGTTEDEKEIYGKDVTYENETEELWNKYISELTLDDLEDLEKIALVLIAKIRFRFSSAYYILLEMKSLLDSNDDLNTLEAALYSSVKYITDFLLEQVETVRF